LHLAQILEIEEEEHDLELELAGGIGAQIIEREPTTKMLVIVRKVVVALFALLATLMQKLWRRLRWRHPSHESPKLELPRFGREPPQL